MEEIVDGKKKKLTILFSFIALGVLAICGVVGAFLINYNSHSPSAPVILDDGKNISITTNMNDNYKGYRFRFKNGEEEILIDSQQNILSLDTLLENQIQIGQTYKVSVCYLGETAGSGSEYSKQTSWTCQKYLDDVLISNDTQNQAITWEAVEDANYSTVYFNENGQISEFVTETLSFDYSSIKGGEKEVYVVASSNNANYKSGSNANTLKFTHKYRLQEIERASFNSGTLILSVFASEEIQFLTVTLDGVAHIVKIEGMKQEDFVYNIDMTSVYYAGARIGVAPSPADEFSVFEGEILYI